MSAAAPDDRFAALRARGAPPLWSEALPLEESLREVRGRVGPIFRLQEAHVLLELGRVAEARRVLGTLGELPGGLSSLRDELLGRCGSAPAARPEPRSLASRTLAELYAGQGDSQGAAEVYGELLTRDPGDRGARQRRDELLGRGAPSGVAALEQWLGRVRGWRRALGV